MNCKICQEEIDKYLEGSLPPGSRQQFEQHLEICEECSEKLRILKVADIVISEEKRVESNPFLSARIMAILEGGELKKSASIFDTVTGRIIKPALIGVVIAISVFLGVGIGNLDNSEYLFRQVPDEITYIDDAEIESLYIYLTE
jgi:predicted anti-sigma-YlaC factor YlaD